MPLCPELYHYLVARFGEVKITHEGEPFTASPGHYVDRTGERRTGWNITNRGEAYRVCCPVCGDSKFRLWINHRWGRYDNVTNSCNLSLLYCFHTGNKCFSEYEVRRQLCKEVFEGKDVRSLQMALEPSKEFVPRVPVLPGTLTRLDQLPTDHHANDYLRTRGYDPNMLGQALGVSYCTEASDEFPLAANRIIIPVMQDKVLRGWQARYIGDRDWKATGLLKYYSMPGMNRQALLYNYDNAKEFPYAVIVEGPLDTWSVGRPGIGTFGKCVSKRQKDLIVSTWKDGCVFVFLDNDATDEAQALCDELSHEIRYVVPLSPPAGRDPGSTPMQEVWSLVDAAIKSRGIVLT